MRASELYFSTLGVFKQRVCRELFFAYRYPLFLCIYLLFLFGSCVFRFGLVRDWGIDVLEHFESVIQEALHSHTKTLMLAKCNLVSMILTSIIDLLQ
jgi:hypothetical protein